jgi:hypothetical protein
MSPYTLAYLVLGRVATRPDDEGAAAVEATAAPHVGYGQPSRARIPCEALVNCVACAAVSLLA